MFVGFWLSWQGKYNLGTQFMLTHLEQFIKSAVTQTNGWTLTEYLVVYSTKEEARLN